MLTRPNPEDQTSAPKSEDPRVDRRTRLRYHFAQLLLSEKFDQALHEALAAWGQEEILPCDLEFVVDIIRSAELKGTTTIDRTRFPDELLSQATKSRPIPAPASRRNAPSAQG